jgi:cell division cycle protein 37
MSAINYSKWDRIELSDDEDFECHPNVDKKSFIKWKQQDIHRQREERKERIKNLTLETTQNVVLLERIRTLSANATADKMGNLDAITNTVQHLKLRGEEPDASRPAEELPAYDTMIAALCAQIQTEIQTEVDAANGDAEKISKAFATKLVEHEKRLADQQEKSLKELEKLKKEESAKLTSENMFKPGFDKTVNRASILFVAENH